VRASNSFPAPAPATYTRPYPVQCLGWSAILHLCGCHAGDTVGEIPKFCQTKIENLGVTALADKNVGWVDVAMNDAFRVSGVKSVGPSTQVFDFATNPDLGQLTEGTPA
jgi:hypothetical protein